MFKVIEEKCVGCGLCQRDCPAADIEIGENKKAVIKGNTCFGCAHCVAVCPCDAVFTDQLDMNEMQPIDYGQAEISPEKLLAFFKARRSVRQFKDEPVAKELLETIIEAGRAAPTASNAQDTAFLVVQNQREEITDFLYQLLKAQGEKMQHDTTIPKGSMLEFYGKLFIDMFYRYHDDKKKNDRLFFNASAIIFITADREINGAIAAANMELMANALGLGCCYVGFALRALEGNAEALAKVGVREGKKLVTCLAIGHPNVKYIKTAARQKAQVDWR